MFILIINNHIFLESERNGRTETNQFKRALNLMKK